MCSPMTKPVCLVTNVNSSLCVNTRALEYLSNNNQPVVVVSVVGLYRTGKSYLMNHLAGKQTGFALGSTIESKTKGIWMWCVPHPLNAKQTLVLLDTEGLGDIDKGDSKNDAWIFCLAVLLSSTLVYNSRGTIDNTAVEKLQNPYVTELAEQIKIKSPASRAAEDEEEEDCNFVQFFPNFIWTVRDFSLELEIEKRGRVTEDEYLEFALQLKKGLQVCQCHEFLTNCGFGSYMDEALFQGTADIALGGIEGLSIKNTNYNLPRQCIRNYFPTRKCFVFPFPAPEDKMVCLETLDESEISPKFLNVTKQFCDHISAASKVKTLKGGYRVTGRIFGHLLQSYVETISSGKVPCLENAVVVMAQIENQAALEEGLKVYQSGMEQVKSLFPVKVSELSAEHQKMSNMASTEFMKRSFKDEGQEYFKKLVEAVDQHYAELIAQNMEASDKKCQQILSDLYEKMNERVQRGEYAKPGGYNLYCTHRQDVITQYNSHPIKGIQGDLVLERFLSEKSVEAKLILQTDEQLTESEKKVQEEKEQAALLEQQCKAERNRNLEITQLMKEEKEHHEQRMKQMEKKFEEEKLQQQQELERAMERKLAEQTELLKKGFNENARMLELEIEQLKRQKNTESGNIFKDFFMPILGTVVSKVLGGISKVK